MNFVPEWAPNVHPMFVHFPIGLLMTAVALDLLSLLPKMTAIRSAVPVLYVVGAVAAIATYFTGQAAADGISIPADAEPILTEHADLAFWTVIFFSAYAVIRLITAKILNGPSTPVRAVFVLVAGFGLYLIWETGEHGSEMVYSHGVGVRQPAVEEIAPPARVPAENALRIHDGGWMLEPAGAASLASADIHWLHGGPDIVSALDSSGALALTLDGNPAMFVIRDTLENVQVTAEWDRSGFAGTVSLLHHVQSANTYDYLSIRDGEEMRLGRVEDGEERTFDEATAPPTGWSTVRVTGDGTHFRGYVDDQMIVHGHADPLPEGTVGLRLEGEGTLRLRRIQARGL